MNEDIFRREKTEAERKRAFLSAVRPLLEDVMTLKGHYSRGAAAGVNFRKKIKEYLGADADTIIGSVIETALEGVNQDRRSKKDISLGDFGADLDQTKLGEMTPKEFFDHLDSLVSQIK